MHISLKWLKEFVDFDLTFDELDHRLTMLGIGIESVKRGVSDMGQVVVGKILAIDPHPNADKLVVCRTDVGEGESLQIVCGATNMSVGDKVPTALPGATLPGGFKIARRKLRGVESNGMMCSPKELGIGEDHEGLLIMAPEAPLGEDIIPVLNLDDTVFEIEVTPNRGDWAGMIGVARELAALLDTELRIPEIQLTEGGPPASELSSVRIEDPELCPRYIGRVVTGVKVGPSPAWLCQRLLAGGLRPINNVVDATNYVLLETGHPLHAFDYDQLAENRIVVRTATSGETIKTIDQEVHQLTPDMLVIADAQRPVAVAGVMGGFDSEVGETTTNLFLESAWFDPQSVRKTARALGMMTEASQRFQRGSDPEMVGYAMDRMAALIQELTGAQIAPGVLDEYPRPHQPVELRLRYARTDSLLGSTVPPDKQVAALSNLGFHIMEPDDKGCRVGVPSWRQDLSHEADLIEEIARLHGYDKIPVTLPKIRQNETVFAPHETTLRKLRQFLIALGLTEVINMSFTSNEELRRAGLADAYPDTVTLMNPLSDNLSAMRPSLVPGLLNTVSINTRRGVNSLMAFEIGPVYTPASHDALPIQHTELAIILTGQNTAKHWSRPAFPFDLFDLKGIAETLFVDFFRQPCQFHEADIRLYQPARSAELRVDDTPLGAIGEIASKILRAYDIDQSVYLLTLHLESILSHKPFQPQFTVPPKFPPSLRDLAITIPKDTPAAAIRDAACKAGGQLLASVDIFDVYTGAQIAPDMKSLALSLAFQSPDRTLTDKETDKLCEKILRKLKTAFKAELR